MTRLASLRSQGNAFWSAPERQLPAQEPKSTGKRAISVESFIDTREVNPVLNDIMLAELAGVIRYTHYSLVITGPNRLTAGRVHARTGR